MSDQRMKLCGHTMGTPGKDLFQALTFFSSLGLDSVEVRCARDGQIDPEQIDPCTLVRALESANELGLSFACLTPYYKDFSAPIVRERELAGFRRVIDVAARLRCPLVRAYGGVLPPPGIRQTQAWARTVSALRELADYAGEFNVALAIETHGGTLTATAAQAADMAAAVARPNVGILFDFVWIKLAGAESLADAIRLCGPWIRHVHVKDCIIERPANQSRPCLMGCGEIELVALLRALRQIDYAGCISDEYEKYWCPELPEPEVGMRVNASFLRQVLAEEIGA